MTKQDHRSTGFTIVELLIVIVVIGILAAIVIVAYNNVQGRSRVSAVQSDLINVKKNLMIYNVDNGRYPVSSAQLTDAKLAISSTANYEVRTNYNNFYYCVNLADNEFAIGVRAATTSNDKSFYISSSEGVTPHAGVISQALTCEVLGLTGTGSADGAYSVGGLIRSGSSHTAAGWLQANS